MSDLVIEYVDTNNISCSKTINKTLATGYIMNVIKTDEAFKDEIKECLNLNTYQKIVYENDHWLDESNEKLYSLRLVSLSLNMNKIIK
jgi:TusA-related sulfurtransferase